LAAIGLLNRFVDVGVELLVLFDQTQSGLLHQLLGGSALVIGNLRKPRLLFGREMYFRALRLGSRTAVCQENYAPKDPSAARWAALPGSRNALLVESRPPEYRLDCRLPFQSSRAGRLRNGNGRVARNRPRHLNRHREDLGKRSKRRASGPAVIACQQVVQLEQSHE
jgi:hypothetical protein